MKLLSVKFKVNGNEVQAKIPANRTLLYALRELGYTEVKNGCEKGDCGACTVLLDGQPVNSCLVLAIQVQDREITTVRGLGTEKNRHPLQEKFIEHGAVQCGFCTPGMILSAKALLDKNRSPKRKDIEIALSGNLCRCTGYVKIIDAVEAAAVESSSTSKGVKTP
jgi:carbon-monoxide dehydrogenase small subunit